MAPDLSFPDTPPPVMTRTRVKWENLAILGGGAVVATFAVVLVLIQGAEQPPEPAVDRTPAPAQDATTLPTESGGSALTMADALGLVEEARQFITEARWDEAAERLDSVPADLRDAAGATQLATQLVAARTQHEQLRAQAVAAVEARRWTEADQLLDRLAAIAPLDAELQALRTAVDQALTPAPAVAAGTTGAADSTDTANADASRPASGGGRAATDQAAAPARPASASTPKPAAAAAPTRPSGSNATSGSPAAIDPLAPVELTPEQEAEIAAALGFATGDLQ